MLDADLEDCGVNEGGVSEDDDGAADAPAQGSERTCLRNAERRKFTDVVLLAHQPDALAEADD